MAAKKSSGRKYGRKASKKVARAMHERKRGTLKSGSGRKVTSRKQAIAIGLSEAREEGAKVPRKSSRKKSSSRKSTAKKSTAKKGSSRNKSTAKKSSSRKKSTSKRSSSTRKKSTSKRSSSRKKGSSRKRS